jgi:8-oxo-dGTP pyrophosphatase MutT (NUDIX family)
MSKQHTFNECSSPVISYGILGFKIINNEPQYLLVQRKDTIGYIDFLRSKFNPKIDKQSMYKILLEEMTENERQRLKYLTFDELWDDLWINHKSRTYLNEYKNAKLKFSKLDITNMVDNTYGLWCEQEYCIPKGRRSLQTESNIDCAIREFKEETNIKESQFKIVYSLGTLTETFQGSNGVFYTHTYFLAELDKEYVPKIDNSNKTMIAEVKNIKFFNFKEALNVFRHYEHTKRNIIYKADKLIKKNLQM